MKRVFYVGLCGAAIAGLAFPVMAQTAPTTGLPFQAGYDATIWIDPDGCQHWVLDTGNEGFMSQRLDRNGKPVCGEVIGCGTIDADILFPVDGSTVSAALRPQLSTFFATEAAKGTTFVIEGHTDNTWTEDYNMALSQRRADAVAAIAAAAGAQVSTEAFGESRPVASNDTASGRQQNRRVEIVCK